MGDETGEQVFAITGPRRRARLRLQGSFFVVGRAEPFPVFRDDPMLSREHLAVVALPDGIRVRDLGSRNGVLLNGERLGRYAEVRLAPGDVLLAGQTELRLLTEAERAALDPAAPLDEHAVDADGRSKALRLDAVLAAAGASPPAPDGTALDDPALDGAALDDTDDPDDTLPGGPLTEPGEVDDVDALGGEATSELDVPALPPQAEAVADDPPTIGDLPTAIDDAPTVLE